MYSKSNRERHGLPASRRPSALKIRSAAQEDTPIFKRVFINSLISVLVTAIIGVILTSIMAFIALQNEDPSRLVPYLSLLSLLIACFVGGFTCASKTGSSPLLCGAVYGATLCIFMLLCALCMVGAPKSEYTVFQGILTHGVAVLFCVLGALAGSAKKKASPKKRRFGN